jgi:hypothetical protein
VVYDPPCLFRQAAMEALETAGLQWCLSLTTPSLPGVWAAIRTGLGVSVRTGYGCPAGIRSVGVEQGLSPLPVGQPRA